MIKAKITSSLEKIFLNQRIDTVPTLDTLTSLRGERVSFQIATTYDPINSPTAPFIRVPVKVESPLREHVSLRVVDNVPVTKPVHDGGTDDNYLSTEPGLYPDLLRPLYSYSGATATVVTNITNALWAEITVPEELAAGVYPISFVLEAENPAYGSVRVTLNLDVIGATLPKEDIYYTQWFHTDCLANYYCYESWSEEHWRVVEEFAKTAVRGGMNMILTPVFTPPLDTAVGGERRTVQLVDVTVADGEYSFSFDKLGRWIDVMDRVGIKYFEISHFFTQWGAAHAPKIMAMRGGEYVKIFGWETDATGDEYVRFLRSFLPELIKYMKGRGDDRRMFFHVSDEPGLLHLEQYRAARAVISDLLEGYTIMDALSKLDFYSTGAISNPIPSSNHIHDFIDAGVKDLWTYYCVSQYKDVSNRYISMPGWRTRAIGMQIYKYDIKGFLQWGYNFYNNQFSVNPLNPYIDTAADFTFPAGDSFTVYPAPDGSAYESVRFSTFYEALQDVKAMKLCESLWGREAVVEAIDATFGKPVTFFTCPHTAEQMLAVRRKINEMIRAKA